MALVVVFHVDKVPNIVLILVRQLNVRLDLPLQSMELVGLVQ